MSVTWRKLGFDEDVSTADSKAVSAQAYAASADTSLVSANLDVDQIARSAAASADSKAVSAQSYAGSADTSAVTRLSAVDSGIVVTVTTADSKGVSAGTLAATASSAASIADSKGSVALSYATSLNTSGPISVADSKATSAGSLAGTHAARHKNGSGTDELLLSDFGEPTAVVKFDNQQATDFILHNTATMASLSSLNVSVAIGKIAYVAATSGMYVCTVAA